MGDQNRHVTGYPAPPGYSQPNPAIPSGYSTPATSGTAYPYAAPPPAFQNPNPYYNPYQQDPYATQRAARIRRIFSALIAAVIIAGTIFFIFWMVFRPRLPEFRVDSFSVSNFNLSSSTSLLSANLDAQFHVRNPNKKTTLSYDEIEAAVFYKSQTLSETTLPPFDQDTRNETTIRGSFAPSGAYVEKSAADDINSDRASRDGTVGFHVRLTARVQFKDGGWRDRRRFLRVHCVDLGVRIPSNGNGNGLLVGGPKQCRVGL